MREGSVLTEYAAFVGANRTLSPCIERIPLPPLADYYLPIDDSTEQWLETLRQRLRFCRWYAGHFHIDYLRDNVTFLFDTFTVFDS